jgi:cell division protein FtsW (lipid II flippase)
MPQLPDPGALSAAAGYTHMRIVLGMVVGLGLTHLLRQFARMIEHPGRKRLYWVHMVWVVSMFFYLLSFWWWEYRLSHRVDWTFNLYLFVTLYALLLYLLCTLVFPENIAEYRDWRDYFYRRRAWFFGLLALAYAVDLGDTLAKGQAYFAHFGPEMWLRSLAYVVFSLVAIATANPRYHAAFALAGLAYQLSFIARQFEAL